MLSGNTALALVTLPVLAINPNGIHDPRLSGYATPVSQTHVHAQAGLNRNLQSQNPSRTGHAPGPQRIHILTAPPVCSLTQTPPAVPTRATRFSYTAQHPPHYT